MLIVHYLKNIKKQYALFIITMAMTLVGSQILIQYDLSKQNEDAQLINLAGSQPTLSQRIAKLVLYIHEDITNERQVREGRLDTLNKLVTRWERTHRNLMQGDTESGLSDTRSPEIDSLLSGIDKPLTSIVQACRKLIQQPDSLTSSQAVSVIEENELNVLHLMQSSANRYQLEAEEKLTEIKNIEIGLAIAAIIMLCLEFTYLVLPVIRKIQEQNQELTGLNNQLASANEELQASEEELRTNLDYITLLQEEVTVREEQYRELVENASDMIYEIDAEGRISFANQVTPRIMGYSLEELKQFLYSDLLDPLYAPEVLEFYQRQVENQIPETSFEVKVVTKSGARIWLEQNTTMTFENGTLKRARIIGRDVSKKKQAEIALIESEQRFRTLAENAPIGIFQTDTSGKCIFVNKSWCSIAGIDFAEAMGDGWGNSVYKADREEVFTAWQQSLVEGKVFEMEFRFENPKRGTRIVHTKANRVSVGGDVLGFIGAMNDVTELREAQMKLSESEKLYRELSENSEDLITINSPSHSIVYVSSSSPRILGKSPASLINTSYIDLVVDEDLSVFNNAVNKSQAVKSVQHVEYRLQNSEGDRWMDTHIQPIFSADGSFSSYQVTSRDVTSKKEVEFALQDAKRKAEEATNAKSQFLSMMSHEIRTPMNAIIGLTNILLQENPRDDQRESLRLLKFSGDNLLTIINDILDFSKIEAGKIVLEEVDVDLKELMTNITRMLEVRAIEKGIQLRYDFKSNAGVVFKTDSVRLSQIVTNLIGNAIKFTEEGYVELHVEAIAQADKARIIVAVSDTGIGIAPEKLKVIFESFSQAASDTTRKFGGTGLGLSITKRLIELMGSEIILESTLGQGSKFSFEITLPVGKASQTTANAPQNLNDFKHAKVLLVEDNRVNQIVATNFLKKWGLTIDIANNGLEAVNKVISKAYGIILMDLQMPEMDGYTATKEIREIQSDPYFKKVPIIALTASAMMDVRGKVLETGMNDFITKPFEPDDLYQKISSYILIDTPHRQSRVNRANLDIYTEGDPDFKRELASHLIKNIQELQNALEDSIRDGDPEHFNKAAHKIKTTVGMLGDQEFSDTITSLKDSINGTTPPAQNVKERFTVIAKDLIEGLNEEMQSL